MINFVELSPPISVIGDIKIKSAATEVTAQKTQTPIVAKLYRYEKHYVLTPKESAFLSNSR